MLDEAAARAIVAVRAVETDDVERRLLTDADRAFASRAAGEMVGAAASSEAFLARRAGVALERLQARHARLHDALGAPAWRRLVTPVVAVVALLAGIALDELGADGRINLLAPPLLGLLVWNLAIYALLLERWARGWRRRGLPPSREAHPVRRVLQRFAARRARLPRAALLARPLATFAADWASVAAPLYAARAARILHLAAGMLAIGVVAGLYLRGLAFEYRASWSSTFLDSSEVQRVLAVALAPGAAVTSLPVPDAAHLASIRAGALPGSENAARWLHLYAATVALVVIGPRLLLAGFQGWVERRRGRTLALGLQAPYFRRLLREFRAGPLHALVVPYSYAVPEAALSQLRALLARTLGADVQTVAPPMAYGGDDALPAVPASRDATVAIALFNATATPEDETHGAFAAALAALGCAECLALVDESTLRARFDPARIAERRETWRRVLDARRVPMVCVDLAAPDLAVAEADVQRALEDDHR